MRPSLLALLTLLPLRTSALLPLRTARFTATGLVGAGSLGLQPEDGSVIAFGDFDADSFLDLLLLSPDASRVDVRGWDHAEFQLRSIPLASAPAPKGWSIANAVVADLNYDGLLDILLMLRKTNAGTNDESETRMQVWLGDPKGGLDATPLDISSASDAQPIVFDATGDMRVDLLGHAYGEAKGGKLQLWRNAFGEGNASLVLDDAPLQAPSSGGSGCQLAAPHSSAFVDLDGDCLADLFLVCKGSTPTSPLTYEIHVAEKSDKAPFVLSRSGTLPATAGALSFADMDRDGTIDVVFSTCDAKKGCAIHIAHNRQVGLCAQEGGSWFGPGPGGPTKAQSQAALKKAEQQQQLQRQVQVGNTSVVGQRQVHMQPRQSSAKEDEEKPLVCRTPENLCLKDSKFKFNFDLSPSNPDMTTIPLSSILPESFLLRENTLSSPSIPLALTLGDYNKDGFPDLLVITQPDARRPDETRVRLLANIACAAGRRGCPDVGWEGRRTFMNVESGAEVLEGITDARSVSFLDVDEDGTLDLLIQRRPPSRSPGNQGTTLTFIQNNYYHDAFFLKALTLNGACVGWCEPKGAPRFKPWGVNYAGASYKFTVLDTNGVRRAQQVGQLSQSTYRALQTPYSYFGLGRTNNYVESLFVGSTRRQPVHFLAMEGVVPNSHVVIAPWQPEPNGDPSTWRKELYLHPAEWIPAVTIVLVSVILLLASVVFVLHLNEKREDDRERKRAVHAINFDAL